MRSTAFSGSGSRQLPAAMLDTSGQGSPDQLAGTSFLYMQGDHAKSKKGRYLTSGIVIKHANFAIVILCGIVFHHRQG